MEYRTFSLRIPDEIIEYLDIEAAEALRTRTQMIVKILRDHYRLLPTITNQAAPKQLARTPKAVTRVRRSNNEVN